jgi:UDP-N-acetylglucosamine 1-carboxyvinyltransferase
MDVLRVTGSASLKGTVTVSSSKNASLPILAAICLCSKPITLKHLPKLADTKTMLKILKNLGVKYQEDLISDEITFFPDSIQHYEATYDLVKTMRASVLILGPLLARFGEGKVSLPGGCAIGVRPIDLHLLGLEKLGATIHLEEGHVHAKTQERQRLKGQEIYLPFPSVGATENILMAACLAEGVTILKNAALEPEIEDLANFLNYLGASISGIGTSELHIVGVKELEGSRDQKPYTVIGDRIEAATFIMASLATQSSIQVRGFQISHLTAVFHVLESMGASFDYHDDGLGVTVHTHQGLRPFQVDTAPYPGFPTDAQAQLMVLGLCAQGTSMMTEHIFENRFMHVPELNRMGAHIILKGHTAIIQGPTSLTAAPVMCTDLRASAALILAALVAKGRSDISRIYHLERGYQDLEEKLKNLQVEIIRTKEDSEKP